VRRLGTRAALPVALAALGTAMLGSFVGASTGARASTDPLSSATALASFLGSPTPGLFLPAAGATLRVVTRTSGGVVWRQGVYLNASDQLCFASAVPGEGLGFICLAPRRSPRIGVTSGGSDLHGGMRWVEAEVPRGSHVLRAAVRDRDCRSYRAKVGSDGAITAFIPGRRFATGAGAARAGLWLEVTYTGGAQAGVSIAPTTRRARCGATATAP